MTPVMLRHLEGRLFEWVMATAMVLLAALADGALVWRTHDRKGRTDHQAMTLCVSN